jgi:hypothetical protein
MGWFELQVVRVWAGWLGWFVFSARLAGQALCLLDVQGLAGFELAGQAGSRTRLDST